MKFYNRNGMLYARISGRRVSTKLKDTKANRKLFESYASNDEFFKKFNVKKSVPTVSQLCEEILLKKEKTIKPTSLRSYNSLFNSRIVPYFSEMLITEIEPLTIYEYYDTFADASTLNTCHVILKDAFELAIIKGHIKSTPMIISRPHFDKEEKPDPFTLEEVNYFLENTEGWLHNLFGIAVSTGMRPGEIAAHFWNEVKLSELKLKIDRTLTNGLTQSAKTSSSVREVDLPMEALPFFKKQQRLTGLKNMFVFYTPKGKPINSSTTINYYFKKQLEELGIKNRTFYQTRHTFASIRLSAGEKIQWVSWMMGHKDTSVTQQKYYKYIPSVDRDRVFVNIGKAQNRHTP